ncbi:hypothetical protein SDC9_124108 [bioreactor metagenome]|uniref:Uncharacterized protein n=1 Tax=bioreactor metagenome TaxID=1076179 RepID=A0A645CJM2_9ZZZZ
MSKRTLSIVILLVVLILCLAGYYWLQGGQSTSAPLIAVSDDELLVSSTEGSNTVAVYQQDQQLIISAVSEMDFFDDLQDCLLISDPVTAADITISWTTISGNPQGSDHDDRVIARITITDGSEVIYDKKINFVKKALEALSNLLNDRP